MKALITAAGQYPFSEIETRDDCYVLDGVIYPFSAIGTATIGEYAPPVAEIPPPDSVTRRQGRLALLSKGFLDDVEAEIAAITDPVERQAAQIEYESDTWDRDNAFLKKMWAKLGGDFAGLDDLFRLAVTL